MKLRPVLKAFAAAGVIGGFLAEAPFHELLMAIRRLPYGERQRRRAANCSRYSRMMAKAMGFRIEAPGVEHLRALQASRQGYLIVSNHMSFWDIVLLSSLSAPVYITSVEVQKTPVLGWVCTAAGCVFVERRDRSRTGEGLSEITRQLRHGVPVVLYPEGTTSDGGGLLPFKKSFFRAPLESGAPVLLMCLNYRRIDGEPVSAANRDRLFYYGDQTFLDQIQGIFTAREVVAELRFFDPIDPAAKGLDRDGLAALSFETLRSHYTPIRASVSPLSSQNAVPLAGA